MVSQLGWVHSSSSHFSTRLLLQHQLLSHTGPTLVEGLQCRVTELESECDRERVVREEAQRDRDRLKVGEGCS